MEENMTDNAADQSSYEEVRFAASLVKQGSHQFYTLTLPTTILAKTTYVTTKKEDVNEGFQRTLDTKRAQEIADYIDLQHGTIPSSIILSAQPEAEFTKVGRGKTVQFRTNPHAFLILDGQHRVFGFKKSKTAIRVPVVIYNGLSRKDETRIFIDINTKQRPVPNELLLAIKQQAEYESDSEEFLNKIFTLFHDEPKSVLIGLLSSSEKANKKISRVTFYLSIKIIIKFFVGKEPDEIFDILNGYLVACKFMLDKKGAGEMLTNPIVFKALVAFFPTVARVIKDRYGDFTEEGFTEVTVAAFSKVQKAKLKNPGKSYSELLAGIREAYEKTFSL